MRSALNFLPETSDVKYSWAVETCYFFRQSRQVELDDGADFTVKLETGLCENLNKFFGQGRPGEVYDSSYYLSMVLISTNKPEIRYYTYHNCKCIVGTDANFDFILGT